MTSAATATLTLDAGIRVVVPDSINLITPYVILEQGDWFEDEIAFVRTLLRPGERAIDIGANYGLYALSMAQAVGNGGKIWAIEPAAATAALLAHSIAENGFGQISLIQCALSDHAGSARLATGEHAEMNALARDDASAPGETVRLDTLDNCMAAHGWRDIRFVKMDAEGAELDIVHGGAQFLAAESPLIQYEIKAGAALNLALVDAFAALGYRSYRLIPGLNALAPFDAAAGVDGYLLNLFCCKDDTAAELARRGLLLAPADHEFFLPAEFLSRYGWRAALGNLPYGRKLRDAWEDTTKNGNDIDTPLALYLASRDDARPQQERWNALDLALRLMLDLCNRDDRNLRLATLAAIARDYGARAAAVTALDRLVDRITRQGGMNLTEPFVMPCRRLENETPDDALRFWTMSGLLEELETLAAYSSFYTPEASLARLRTLQPLGFRGPAMTRRMLLIEARLLARYGSPSIPEDLLKSY